MKRRTVILTTILLGAAAAGCAADRGVELLDKHIAWRGGRSNLQNLRDITARGKLLVAGLEGPLTLMEQRDGYRKVEYDLGVASAAEFVTPDGGWELNMSGQLDAMDHLKLAGQRRLIDSAFERHLLGGEVVHAGIEEHGGRKWEVLRFGDDDGDYTDLLIDPHDGALTWARTVAGEQVSWEQMEDWRVVDGVRMPFSNKSETEGAGAGPTVVWDEVRLNQNLTPGDFAADKAGRKVVQFKAAAADWIPFTLYEDRYIYMPCAVGGVETELLLDSGAGITVLDKAFADQIGIKGQGEITARGTSGTQSASLASGVNITVGELELTNLTVAIIDLSDLLKRFGRSMPVILGKELFNSTVVDIDYPQRRIRLHDAATFAYEETGHSLEMHPTHDGMRLVELSVEGRPPALFQVDTGSGACVDIFDAYTREQGLLSGRSRVSTAYGGGVGGLVESKLVALDSLDFAGYSIKGVPARFAPPGDGGFGTAEYAGNLGAGVFTRFRVIFDFTRNRLHVEPGPDWDSAPFSKNRLGLATHYEDGKLTILHVAKFSPAERAGVKAGDVIDAVNGESPSEETWSPDMKKTGRAAAGTPVRLRMADGRELRVVLADYY